MTKKEFYIIALVTLVTIIAWGIFDVIHTRSQVEPSSEIQEVLEPINPDFDSQALELLP